MEIEGENYHNWFLLAVPQEGHWTVQCHDPAGEVYTDWLTHETPKAALIAAKQFVDLDIAQATLSYVLDDWLEADQINAKEHWQLLQSMYSNTYEDICQ